MYWIIGPHSQWETSHKFLANVVSAGIKAKAFFRGAKADVVVVKLPKRITGLTRAENEAIFNDVESLYEQ